MSFDNQVALSRITRGASGTLSRATRQVVPPFLQKLYEMVSDSATDNLIRWSDTGDSFFVLDHERVAHDVLPRWFKHNNFASFVRQLNMYGFHKIPHLQQGVLKSDTETELWNFEHPNFHRGQPDLLCLITRKKQAGGNQDDGMAGDKDGQAAVGGSGMNAGSLIDINAIVNGIAAIKKHQATISSDLNDLRKSNASLWSEALAARERHMKQQDTINRILKFLASVFGNHGTPRKGSPVDSSPLPRKRQRLMIEGSQLQPKLETLQPLEPLDDDDTSPVATIDHDDNDNTNLGTHITSPSTTETTGASPAPSVTSTTGTMKSPDISTPFVQFPNQTNMPLSQAETLMGGNFTATSPFVPQQYPMTSTANTAMYNQSADPSSNTNIVRTVTSPTQHAYNQETLLQAILNSPGQLQRLMNLLNIQQQQNVPMPPPLDLNSANPPQDNSTYYGSAQPQLPTTNQVTSSNRLANAVGPDAQTLSLLQPDDSVAAVPFNFEPLMSNEAQLQKTYRDAADISAEVDAMQANLDSLIQNLGLDPSQIASMREAGSEVDGEPIFMTTDDLTPTATPDSTSTAATAPTSESTAPTFQTDNGMKMDTAQYTGTIPDFDFNAFINELNRQPQEQQQQNLGDQSLTGSCLNDFGDYAMGDHTQPSTSPRLSAYVDEVASQSDASSPSIRRASFEDPVVFSSGPGSVKTASTVSRGTGSSDKKNRKRKSDSNFAVGNGSEQSIMSTKPKRKR